MPKTDNETVAEIVSDKVKADEAFTTWEVFQEARKGGLSLQYKDAKPIIQDAIKPFVDQGVYQKSYGVDVGNSKAVLYHPPGYDTASFKAKDVI